MFLCFSTVEIDDILVDLTQIATIQEFLFIKCGVLEVEKGTKEKWNASGKVLNKLAVLRG